MRLCILLNHLLQAIFFLPHELENETLGLNIDDMTNDTSCYFVIPISEQINLLYNIMGFSINPHTVHEITHAQIDEWFLSSRKGFRK